MLRCIMNSAKILKCYSIKKIYKNLADSAVHQFTGDKWHMDYEK